MKLQRLTQLMFLASILILGACQEQAVKTPAPADIPATPEATSAPAVPANWIVVNRKAEISIFGKNVNLEEMKQMLQDSLVKMAVIPEEIPVKFDDEVLMGMRGEIRTEISEALEFARKKK